MWLQLIVVPELSITQAHCGVYHRKQCMSQSVLQTSTYRVSGSSHKGVAESCGICACITQRTGQRCRSPLVGPGSTHRPPCCRHCARSSCACPRRRQQSKQCMLRVCFVSLHARTRFQPTAVAVTSRVPKQPVLSCSPPYLSMHVWFADCHAAHLMSLLSFQSQGSSTGGTVHSEPCYRLLYHTACLASHACLTCNLLWAAGHKHLVMLQSQGSGTQLWQCSLSQAAGWLSMQSMCCSHCSERCTKGQWCSCMGATTPWDRSLEWTTLRCVM